MPSPPFKTDVTSSGPRPYAQQKPKPKPRQPPPIPNPARIIHTDVTTSGPQPYAPQPVKPKPPKQLPPLPDTLSSRRHQPNPTLQGYGVNESVKGLNLFVQTIHDAYQRAYNDFPTAGLVFDILRAPPPLHQISTLFTVPKSGLEAQATGGLSKHQQENPFQYFVRRPDGMLDLPDPIAQLSQATDFATEVLQTAQEAVQQAKLKPMTLPRAQKLYPMVSQAGLPIPNAGDFWNSVVGTKTTPQTTAGEFAPGALGYAEKALGTKSKTRIAADTVMAGQKALQKASPSFFGKLDANGTFSLDWYKAVKAYKGTIQSYHDQVSFDAKANGLSIHDYVRAWYNKQRLLREHPGWYQMISGMSLDLLVHPDSWTGSPEDLAHHLTQDMTWWDVIPVVGMAHLTANAGGLAMNLVGGAINQYKAWATASRIMAQEAGALRGKGLTHDQAVAKIRAALEDKAPTFAKAAGLHLPTWLDQASNFAGDFFLLGAPKLTGEFVPLGDIARASDSRYLNAASRYAFRQLKQNGENGVARAAHLLESDASRGAERLPAAVASDVQSGKLDLRGFKTLVSELYALGKTTYEGRTIRGGLLPSLASKDVVPRNLRWQSTKLAMQDISNAADKALTRSDFRYGNSAANFLSVARNLFEHNYPRMDRRDLFLPKLPLRIRDYVKGEFHDPNWATQLENDFVRARAANDVPAMNDVFDKINERYHAERNMPGGAQLPDPMNALFLTEQRSRVYFPGGGVKDSQTVWNEVEKGAQRMNDALNSVSNRWRHAVLLVTTASRFGKHLVADTLRRMLGGGFKLDRGAAAGISDVLGSAGNEDLLRLVKATENRVRNTEYGYMRGKTASSSVPKFSTADWFGKMGEGRHMVAAAGYVRHIFTDDAIQALLSSTPGNLRPLEDFLSKHPDYSHLIGPADVPVQAQEMWSRYAEVVNAAKEQGIDNPTFAIQRIIHETPGHAIDKKLGQWIAHNRIDFTVRHGLVEQGGPLDGFMNRVIGLSMAPNKWNRSGMFRQVLGFNFRAAKKAGWSDRDALEFSLGLAEKQTSHHMFDYGNMLKIENDLRWVSWFATKHRLFWKWVGEQAFRRPGLLVPAHDISQWLDNKGNARFTLFGQQLEFPVPRMLWLNTFELPEVSPGIAAIGPMAKAVAQGTNPFSAALESARQLGGNVVTPADQLLLTAYHLVVSPKTYSAATGGMNAQQKARFYREVNQRQFEHFQKYHTLIPESEMVKWGLLQNLLHLGVRTAVAFPVYAGTTPETPAQAKLWNQYRSIGDPAKRSKFLDAHPELQAQIGLSKDPRVYAHNLDFFARYHALREAKDTSYQNLFAQAEKTGYWTPQNERDWKAASKQFDGALQSLLLQDAQAKGFGGVVKDGAVVSPGPFGKALEGSPLLIQKDLQKLFPNISKADWLKYSYGERQTQWQKELDFLGTPAGKASFSDTHAWKDRKRELQTLLAPYWGKATNAPSVFHAAYEQQYYGPVLNFIYSQKPLIRDGVGNRAWIKANVPNRERERAYEDFRHWIDSHDHPVKVTTNGVTVTFPSPVRLYWATQPPPKREDMLRQAATDNWRHIPRYLKEALLGRAVSPNVSTGWHLFDDILGAQHGDQKAISDLAAVGINVQPFAPGEKASQRAAYNLSIVKAIDKGIGAAGVFTQDYLFDQLQPGDRLQKLPAVTQSPYWGSLFTAASQFAHAYKNASKTIRVETWQLKIVPQLEAQLQTMPLWFQHQVKRLGPNFLDGLVK